MLRVIAFQGCKETILVLRWLLRQAMRDELRGLAICFWTSKGTREVLLTDVYRVQPEYALGAADLIKVTACHQLDLFA